VKVLDHSTYSPDLTPRDFHLLLHLKKHLADQKFHEDEDVKNEVTTWLCVRRWSFMTLEYKYSYPG